MYTVHINKSHDLSAVEGLVFFFSLLSEQLSIDANDSFRTPSLNTYTRIYELLSLLNKARSSGKYKVLLFVIEELRWSIAKDVVCSSLGVKDDLYGILNGVENQINGHCKLNPDELEDMVRAMQLYVSGYQGLLHKLLRQKVMVIREKLDIQDLSYSYVVDLRRRGYSSRYIKYCLSRYIGRKLKSGAIIDVPSALDDFFGCFNDEIYKFDVVFIADKRVGEFDVSQLKILPNLDGWDLGEKMARIKNNPDDVYVLVSSVNSKDHYAARDNALSVLKFYSACCRFFEHGSEIKISNRAIVKGDGMVEIFAKNNLPPIHIGTKIESSNWVESMSSVFSSLSSGSVNRLARVLHYHQEALDSKAKENQLVDLWAALEGFVSQPSEDNPRIVHYTGYLIPVLSLCYLEKLISYVANMAYSYGDVRELVLNVPSVRGGFLESFAKLLLCDEFLDDRNRILSILSDRPLLKFRMWRLAQQISSPKRLFDFVDGHKRKLNWHICRIYTSRNTIMHSADSLPYLESLIVNLHGYLDALIESCFFVMSKSPSKTTVSGVLNYLKVSESSYVGGLKKMKDSEIGKYNPDDLLEILFGRMNPLVKVVN